MQSLNYLKVVPREGYLNNTFCVLSNKKGKFEISCSNKIIAVLDNNSSNIHSFYFKPDKAGFYSLKFTDSVGKEEIFKDCFYVRDSFILGSSKYKSSYLFDDIPFVFIVKKDRTLVFHIDDEKKFDLFDFSPDSLYKYSDTELLCVVKDNESMQLSILNLEIFETKVIIESVELIHENSEMLIFKDRSVIQFYPKSNNNKIKEFSIEGVTKYDIYNKRFLLVQKKTEYIIYDLTLKSLEKTITINELSQFAINFEEGYILSKISSRGFKLSSFYDRFEHTFQVSDQYFFDKNKYEFSHDFPFLSDSIRFLDYKNFYRQKALQILFKDKGIGMGAWFDLALDANQMKQEIDHIKIIYHHSDCQIIEDKEVLGVSSVQGRKTKQDAYLNDNNILWDIKYKVESSIESKVLIDCLYDVEARQVIYFSFNSIIWFSEIDNQILVEVDENVFLIDKVEKPNYLPESGILYYKTLNGSYGISQLIEGDIIHYAESDEPFEFKYLKDYNKAIGVSQQNVYSYFLNFTTHTNEDIIYPNQSDDYRADKDGVFTVKHSTLKESFLQNRDGLVLVMKKGVILSSIPTTEVIIGSSSDGKCVLTGNYRDSYQLYVYCETNSIYKRLEINDVQISYDSKNSKLLPEGNKLLLKREKSEVLQLYNFDTQEYEDFYDGNFVEFSDEGSIVIEDKHTNKLIIDPNTFKQISSNTQHFYRFKSPDRRLSTPLSVCTEYYIVQSSLEISKDEYNSYKKFFETKWRETKGEYNLRISEFLSKIKVEYQLDDLSLIKEFDDFATFWHYIEVSDHELDEILYLPVKQLNYYNYLAFSPDNKFLTYVGKPINGDGGFGVIELENVNLSYRFKSHHWYPEAEYATWVCGISNKNYFATYNSKVKTFILDLNKGYLNETNCFDVSKVDELTNRSYLNFNYQGNLMSLSQNGYNPVSLGGGGHKKSSMLFIYDLELKCEKYQFSEHSANVVSSAFSKDDKKLFSIDEDGVIIVRNIGLD